MSENKFLKQAREELAYLSNDPDFQLYVESRAGMLRDIEYMKLCGFNQGKEEGLEQGLEQGIEQGIKKEKISLAQKMKAKNMPLDDIIELTGLTKEEIDNLCI